MDIVRTINSVAKWEQLTHMETYPRSAAMFSDLLNIVTPAVRKAIMEDHQIIKVYIRQPGGAPDKNKDFIVKVTKLLPAAARTVSTGGAATDVAAGDLVLRGESLIWYERNALIDDAAKGLSPGGWSADVPHYVPKGK